jgi:hypothetical protein
VKRAAVIALCLLTQACVSGRDYQVPKQAVALSPSANTPFVAGGETAFSRKRHPTGGGNHDDRLDGYIRRPAANTDLRAADANFRRATAASAK